jgi:hypothetical protein
VWSFCAHFSSPYPHFEYQYHRTTVDLTEEEILTDNLTCEQVEQVCVSLRLSSDNLWWHLSQFLHCFLSQIIKEKVAYGLTLPRKPLLDFACPDLPFEIVETRDHLKHFDDHFHS